MRKQRSSRSYTPPQLRQQWASRLQAELHAQSGRTSRPALEPVADMEPEPPQSGPRREPIPDEYRYYIGRAALSPAVLNLVDKWRDITIENGAEYRLVRGKPGLRYLSSGTLRHILESGSLYAAGSHEQAYSPIKSPADIVQWSLDQAEKELGPAHVPLLKSRVIAYGLTVTDQIFEGQLGLTAGVQLYEKPEITDESPTLFTYEQHLFGRATDTNYGQHPYSPITMQMIWLRNSGRNETFDPILSAFRQTLRDEVGEAGIEFGRVAVCPAM